MPIFFLILCSWLQLDYLMMLVSYFFVYNYCLDSRVLLEQNVYLAYDQYLSHIFASAAFTSIVAYYKDLIKGCVHELYKGLHSHSN